jgi:hypothetical protein
MTNPGKWESMYLCVSDNELLIQESERECICVLVITNY